MKNTTTKILKFVIPLLIACISIFVLAKYAASPELHANTIRSLDEKKTTVMELTAASTATSAAITLIPGDTATPIAEKLADLSGYFLIVLCAIYLEKYLVTITGYAAFVVLIPAACVLYSSSVFVKGRACRRMANKLLAFACAIVLIIPASVKVSNLIEATYQSSINETIDSARETAEELEESAEEEESSTGIFSKIKDGVSGITEQAEQMLNQFLESLAIMLVTSCIIPILVILFFVWIIKMLFGANLNLTKFE